MCSENVWKNHHHVCSKIGKPSDLNLVFESNATKGSKNDDQKKLPMSERDER